MLRNNIGKTMIGSALRRPAALSTKEGDTVSIALTETNNEMETLVIIIGTVVMTAPTKIIVSKVTILDLFYED